MSEGETKSRIHSFFPRSYGDIKTAVAALIDAAGGEQRAAEHVRVGKSMLSDYANPNRETVHMPIDVALQLEAATGNMAVTQHLAASHGCLLLKLPDGPVGDADWMRHLTSIGKESGDVFDKCQHFLADDGIIDEKEAPQLLKEIDELLDAVASMRATVMQRTRVEQD